MQVHPMLLTLSTLAVALASAALLVATPSGTAVAQTFAATHSSARQGSLTEVES